MAMDDPHKYLDPLALAKVRSLELQARLIVEGYLSGMHKSPYHGFSVEFAQHREYVAGDDIKHLDWKVWGRTGRFYLKQYEEETNLVCWIMLDTSESMKYGSKDGMSKFDYACMSAAALAYLVLSQSDAVGFVTFDSQIRNYLKPSSQICTRLLSTLALTFIQTLSFPKALYRFLKPYKLAIFLCSI